MRITLLLIIVSVVIIDLYSCSGDSSVVTPPSNDTLSYSFNNFNDSIITITYAVGGKTSSQPVQYTVNLFKHPLSIRFNMTDISSGNMTVQLGYDTLKRQAFTLSVVKDSLRYGITGPADKVFITPTNFKGRGTITVSK